jgi:hypothetical protein
MRYPTLRRALLRFELRSFLASDNEQCNSCDEGNTAEDRGNRNPVFRVRRHMHWSYFQYLFVTGVRETLVGKRQGTKNDQDDSG